MSTLLSMALGFATVAGVGALYFFLLQGKLPSNLYLALAAVFFTLLSYAVFLHLKQKANDAYLDLSEA
jgi:putative Ca2+/H+ antiporter (TMEM165/GDT1 family)